MAARLSFSQQCRALSSPQERLATLKKQSSQIALQAQQERENFQREKNNLLVMLQKVGAVAACCRRTRCVVLRCVMLCLRHADACRRERSWPLWMESTQSCLRGRLFPTAACPSQRWVPGDSVYALSQFQSL